MKRSIILYGVSLALLVFLLKLIEYRYYVHDLTIEFYVTMVALLFASLGAWIGVKLVRRKSGQFPIGEFNASEAALKQTGISKREFEVLDLMSKGNSNQEIADKLFVSLNTVKTHSANLYVKLGAKRRTQAVQRAKELQLIP